MADAAKSRFQLVELDENTFVKTSIPISHHAALRAGFAGYTANPRWTVTKFQAWRVGRTWRRALREGEMTVRADDNVLVPSGSDDLDAETAWLSPALRN
ncbi:MAG: hypothetical protein ACFB4J_07430 [Elainellaceae cyanobacterium]